MTRPWTTLATASTDEGRLELRRRGDADFLIVIGGRVLMNSASRRSEEALATLACAQLKTASAPHVLVAGLGMGYTLRAALDSLPASARVVVAELDPVIVEWCRGPLAAATSHALDDPRVRVEIDDVARVIAAAEPASYDAIVLDLYEGPNAATQRPDDPCYGAAALDQQHRALRPGGVLAVWSEDADAPFAKRMAARFALGTHRIGGGGRRHVVYLGTRR